MDANPRQVIPTQLTMNARQTILHRQAGVALYHRLERGDRLQGTFYYGERWVEQYLNIPIGAQSAPTHSGGVVNLDRGFGGGALRYSNDIFENLKLSLGAEHDFMHDRRKGFINDNGIAGALKRNEDNEVWSTGFYVQGEWKFAERWSAHAGARRSSVRFRNTDYFIVPGTQNGDDSGDRAYSATTPV